MKFQLFYTFAYIIGFIGLLAVCELLHNKLKIQAEYTRKIGHTGSSLLTLFFPLVFQSYGYVLAIGVFSFALLFIGKYLNYFKSIDSVKRKTGGSYLLPISICSVFLVSQGNKLFFILPILVLSISDSLAGVSGTLFKEKAKKIRLFKHEFNKSIIGTVVFSISAFILSVIVLHMFQFSGVRLIVLSLSISSVSAFIEIISPKGTDNITVPYIILALLYLQQ